MDKITEIQVLKMNLIMLYFEMKKNEEKDHFQLTKGKSLVPKV